MFYRLGIDHFGLTGVRIVHPIPIFRERRICLMIYRVTGWTLQNSVVCRARYISVAFAMSYDRFYVSPFIRAALRAMSFYFVCHLGMFLRIGCEAPSLTNDLLGNPKIILSASLSRHAARRDQRYQICEALLALGMGLNPLSHSCFWQRAKIQHDRYFVRG